MYDIISIGAATVDIFIKSDQFQVDSSSPATRLCLPYSSKCEVKQSLICSGGGATNTSVSFSRFGLKSACISRVGHDYFYPIIESELQQENVSNLISLHPQESTDYSIIMVAADGGRTILTNRGNTTLTSTDINWETLSDSKWFHITSLEGNLDLLEQLVGFAYENKIKISLNPGNRELHQPKLLLPLLKYIDFFLLNTTESETLVGRPFGQDGFLDQILSYGPKTIAVTNGRNGAYVATSQEKIFSPIINTTPVDETGAGDSFGSAFVAAQIYGKNIHQSLDWAVHNSASVVSHLGSKPGLLTLNQLK